jgi:hypothetical protein
VTMFGFQQQFLFHEKPPRRIPPKRDYTPSALPRAVRKVPDRDRRMASPPMRVSCIVNI